MRSAALALKVLLVGLITTVVGCGDPKTSRLSPGQEMIVAPDDGKPVFCMLKEPTLFKGAPFLWIAPGTKVRVAGDPGEYDFDSRKVATLILEGESAGIPAEVARGNLRPIK